MSLGTPAIINNIIVDEYLINNWPDNFSGCWIGIYKKGIFTTAYLVNDDSYPVGTVAPVTDIPHNYIASITWDFLYYLRGMYTKEEYRSLGLGYTIGVWARTWVAVNEGKKIHPPKLKNRVEQVTEFLRLFKETYSDEEISL
jgi:hypothetical protein